MACCGNTEPQTQPRVQIPAHNITMLYRTRTQNVKGYDGLTYSMQTPLVRTPGRPSGGWRVVLPIKGSSTPVDGSNPVEVYNNTVVLLARNGINLTSTEIWFNLNLQWVARTNEKHVVVRIEDLMALVVDAGGEEERAPGLRSYKPADWGSIAWRWLNLFLAREKWDYNEFTLQLRYVWDMLNPVSNPGLGCNECYSEFTILFGTVRDRPLMTQEEARQWLWETHNKVNRRLGKPEITYQQASKLSFWV